MKNHKILLLIALILLVCNCSDGDNKDTTAETETNADSLKQDFQKVDNIPMPNQSVQTADSDIVLLKNDGTWETVKDSNNVAEENFNFRKTQWGMTKSQVRKSESAEISYVYNDGLTYMSNIADLECLIDYIFVDNKLIRTQYRINTQHTNLNDYLSDYYTLKKLLSQKYGNPPEEETIWKNDTYQDDVQYWGMAVSLGHMIKFAFWNTGVTEIGLVLRGDNYDILLGINYTSEELRNLEKEKKQKDALNNL